MTASASYTDVLQHCMKECSYKIIMEKSATISDIKACNKRVKTGNTAADSAPRH